MEKIIYTATGCSRCKIAKKFMDEQGIVYRELDIKGDGKEPFGQFYRSNRNAVYRGKEGIEFPVLVEGGSIRQGVGVALAYLHSGTALEGFIGRSDLSHGWMDGIHVSGGDPSLTEDLVLVLDYLGRNGMKLQLETNGKNASVLERLLEKGLGDRVVMDLQGPLPICSSGLGADPEEIKKTIALVAKFPEYQFRTTVGAIVQQEGDQAQIRYIKPEEVAEAAALLKEVTGSHKQPYLLRPFDPATCVDERFRNLEKLPSDVLLKYRSVARRHQVLTEIEKAG
jgi:pyruvate-formate lyase-activating enzyme/glutaredoxin